MHNVLQLESLQQENEQLKDKLEEVTLDLEILKNEVSEGGKIIFSIEYLWIIWSSNWNTDQSDIIFHIQHLSKDLSKD